MSVSRPQFIVTQGDRAVGRYAILQLTGPSIHSQAAEQIHLQTVFWMQATHDLGIDAEIIDIGFRRDPCLGLAVIIDNSQVDTSIRIGLVICACGFTELADSDDNNRVT